MFVAHQGKEELKLVLGEKEFDNNHPATRRADWGGFAFKMMRLIVENGGPG